MSDSHSHFKCQQIKIWWSHPVFSQLDWYNLIKASSPAFSLPLSPHSWKCLYKPPLIKLSPAILLQSYQITSWIFFSISFLFFLTLSNPRSYPVWSSTKLHYKSHNKAVSSVSFLDFFLLFLHSCLLQHSLLHSLMPLLEATVNQLVFSPHPPFITF